MFVNIFIDRCLKLFVVAVSDLWGYLRAQAWLKVVVCLVVVKVLKLIVSLLHGRRKTI